MAHEFDIVPESLKENGRPQPKDPAKVFTLDMMNPTSEGSAGDRVRRMIDPDEWGRIIDGATASEIFTEIAEAHGFPPPTLRDSNAYLKELGDCIEAAQKGAAKKTKRGATPK